MQALKSDAPALLTNTATNIKTETNMLTNIREKDRGKEWGTMTMAKTKADIQTKIERPSLR
jgi:hypothetical protein